MVHQNLHKNLQELFQKCTYPDTLYIPTSPNPLSSISLMQWICT